MILVVGPASSGKTTTLSSMVSALKSGRTNITTIEDPIEYLIPGINQTRVNEKAKLTFASSLRAILRQDPDVVLVGELRDQETAKMVTHAAQTGRLLVYTPEAEMLRALSISDDAGQVAFYKAVGCDECNHTGYQGRIALCEVMRVNDRMRRLIAQRAGEDLIREAAVESGMISLGEDGLGKVKAGITTPEELLRVVTEVREMRGLCPACSCAVAIDFHVCPGCGHRLGLGCPKCSRALQPGWNFCPYCSSSAVSKKKKKSKEHKPAEAPPSNVAEFKNQNR
jgi:type II secretory ATPase GspE/PulE/Tfp pilus assembly ATPase PilB-like protein